MGPAPSPVSTLQPWDTPAKRTQEWHGQSLLDQAGREVLSMRLERCREWEQEEACPPKMPTSASTLCPGRCPLDGAPGQRGPWSYFRDGQGLGPRTVLPVPSLRCQRRGEGTVQQGHGEVRGAGRASGVPVAGGGWAGPPAAKTTVGAGGGGWSRLPGASWWLLSDPLGPQCVHLQIG